MNENNRLNALHDLEILDTPPENEFDSLVQAAAKACGTPLAFLNFVDAERLWCKASFGAAGKFEMPRSATFCKTTIQSREVIEVPDAALDPRFADLDLVKAGPGLRFYAGAPIVLADNHSVGAICVHDVVPRHLEPAQREVLRCLAIAAARTLESRKALLAQHRMAQSFQAATMEHATRERLQRYYEATPAMLHSIDGDGLLVMVSDLWLSKLGYAREEVIGRRSTDFMTEASQRHALDFELPEFFRRGRSENVGYTMIAKDGTLIEVLMSALLEREPCGAISHSLTVVEDVTDRLRAERALKESEAIYRGLAEATNDVIVQCDVNMVQRYVSPSARAVLGFEPDELHGQHLTSTIHASDAAAAGALFSQLTAGCVPGDRAMATYRTLHKDGHWIWTEVGLNLVRDPVEGGPLHVICAMRDVSERRRVAEQLEVVQAAAMRAVQSKTEFLANVSHELRTPLTSLLGTHALLATAPDLAPHHRRQLASAQEAGHSLMTLINDVLDFSKIEAGQLSVERVPFDLHALVCSCRDFVHRQAVDKGLTLTAVAPTGLHLLGDPMRLRQVLVNLVANAVKFTSEGEVEIEAAFNPHAGRLHVAVRDTGIGIPVDQQDAIFERFRQADGSTSRKFGGTGLGLSICKHLIETMGGTISVSSTPGVGSVFNLELPTVVAVETSAAEADQRVARAAVPRRVLLAEDNELNRTIIAEMLSRAGHRVVAVCNGAEAVNYVVGTSKFDVVLMDVQMPVLDGISATRFIRDREDPSERRLPIVGLTANATSEDLLRQFDAGMDAHIAKPIDWPELFALLDRIDTGALLSAGQTDSVETSADFAIIDWESLEVLEGLVGAVRLADMLKRFLDAVQGRLDRLAGMTHDELVHCVHGWTSMAGHLGFVELQHHAAALHADAREGRGLSRVTALHDAAERALEAGNGCRFLHAA